MFSSADLSLAAEKMSQAASGMILQNQWRLPVTILSIKIAASSSYGV
jgi:hypothetical protein